MAFNRSLRSEPVPGRHFLAQPGMIAMLCAAALAWVAGAAQAQSPAGVRITEVTAASHPYTVWQCARLPIDVRAIGNLLEVVVDGESRILMQGMAASGARYVAPGDESTEFWSKGGLANVTWSGNELPTCAEEGTLVTPLSASGNEPFWALNYDGWGVELSEPGEPVRRIEIEGQSRTTNGWRLESVKGQLPLQVDVADAVCQDTMSGVLRPYTVALNFGGRVMRGCGGDSARLLQGVEWTLKTVGGAPLTAPASLAFMPNGRLAGSNGCNRLVGGYEITGEGLRFSQMASTRMACEPAIMHQADRLDQYLATVRGFSFDAQGALVLHAEQGDVIAVAADQRSAPAAVPTKSR